MLALKPFTTEVFQIVAESQLGAKAISLYPKSDYTSPKAMQIRASILSIGR